MIAISISTVAVHRCSNALREKGSKVWNKSLTGTTRIFMPCTIFDREQRSKSGLKNYLNVVVVVVVQYFLNYYAYGIYS